MGHNAFSSPPLAGSMAFMTDNIEHLDDLKKRVQIQFKIHVHIADVKQSTTSIEEELWYRVFKQYLLEQPVLVLRFIKAPWTCQKYIICLHFSQCVVVLCRCPTGIHLVDLACAFP